MTALALLQHLHDLGVALEPSSDGTLRCRVPKGVLTPALVDRMREHKAELHGLVEAFEERAAMAEFEAGSPRAEAEALAWQCVLGEEEAKDMSGDSTGCSASPRAQGDRPGPPERGGNISPAEWEEVHQLLDRCPGTWITERQPEVMEVEGGSEDHRTALLELRPPWPGLPHCSERETVTGVQTAVCPIPDPHDTQKQYEQYHHRDVRGMSLARLEVEQMKVLWCLALDERPHPWLRQRLKAVHQEIAQQRASLIMSDTEDLAEGFAEGRA
jgi:hypothetical protein